MKNMILRLLYILIAIKINVFRKNVKVNLTARIKPGTILKGYNKISSQVYLNGEIGLNSYIGKNSIMYAYIGNYCSIGANVSTVIGTHPTNFVSSSPVFYSTMNQTGLKKLYSSHKFDEILDYTFKGRKYGIKIGNDVWIGDNVMIKGGIEIGDGAIIAMGSVVTKDVQPFSIVGGVPARLIRYRFDKKTIFRLLESKWWLSDIEKLKKYSKYMNDVDIFLREWYSS